MRVFLDTSYFIARLERLDQWHARAAAALRPNDEIYTSSMIVNETVSLLQVRNYFSVAIEFLSEIRSNERIQIIHVDPAIQAEAWDTFARWGSSGANAIDCVSFAIMRRFGLRKAMTFDGHFRAAGFDTLLD